MSQRTVSNEEMLDWIRDWIEEHETTPRLRDADEHAPLTGSTYCKRFGTWNEAIRNAGFDPNEYRPDRYTDEELLSWIDAFVMEYHIVPTGNDFMEGPTPRPYTYDRRFGSFVKAIKKAGYTPRSEH